MSSRLVHAMLAPTAKDIIGMSKVIGFVNTKSNNVQMLILIVLLLYTVYSRILLTPPIF